MKKNKETLTAQIGATPDPTANAEPSKEMMMYLHVMELTDELETTKTVLTTVLTKIGGCTITEEDYKAAGDKYVEVNNTPEGIVLSIIDKPKEELKKEGSDNNEV